MLFFCKGFLQQYQLLLVTAEVLPLVTKLCAMRATWEQATAGMEKQTAAAE